MATNAGAPLVCCLLVLLSTAALGKVIRSVPEQHGVEFGPRNQAVYLGATVTLGCQTDGVTGANIRWYEYVTTGQQVLISDGLLLITSHPNYARYSLSTPDGRTFNLNIANVNYLDAGFYECIDSSAAPPSVIRLGSELVVLEKAPTCNSTYPFDTGAVLETAYHTIQCIQSFNATPGIRPLQTWTGPPPFNYGYSYTENLVWSGISFNADRSMNGRNWLCLTNFTDDLFFGLNRDVIAPTYTALSPSNQIFVYWGPQNLTVSPIQASYEIGQTITCWSDAYPNPAYIWQSVRTTEMWNNNAFTTREDMVGYQLMRCTSSNTISGISYSRDIFLDVYVNPVTTPPTTTTPASTTTAPAWGDCNLLTGQWASTNPNAQLCITVDTVSNSARMTGLYKNGTDSFWMNVVGMTRVDNSNTLAWTMVFPSGMIGVSSYAAECHSCFGTEQILANGISRTTLDSQFCGSGGTVNASPQLVFYRVPTAFPCTASPSEMKLRHELNLQGKLMASGLEQ